MDVGLTGMFKMLIQKSMGFVVVFSSLENIWESR